MLQGTNIAAGKCRGVVIGTGLNTEIGLLYFANNATPNCVLSSYFCQKINKLCTLVVCICLPFLNMKLCLYYKNGKK